jgi:methionine biosynthesis protein MetW
MRPDLKITAELIKPGARVLDLGCGDGELLEHLQSHKGVNGYGLEINPDNITNCINKGVNVIEQDLDSGLENFADSSFDMVIMTETLQAVKAPDRMLREMLRIGEQCIVTFPNFAYWRCRLHLAMRGRMPVSRHLPHNWYDTPNIHLCTFKDFEQLCDDNHFNIVERFMVDASHNTRPLINRFPNFFGAFAFYRLGREPS